MRLKQSAQSTIEATTSVYGAQVAATPVPHAPGSTHGTEQGAAATTAYPTVSLTESRFPDSAPIVKVAALGLLYGVLICGVLAAEKHSIMGASQSINSTATGIYDLVSAVTLLVTCFLLPGVLAFIIGVRQREWTRGAVLGFVLGATTLAAAQVVMGLLPALLFIPLDLPRIAIALTLLLGALGGACGRVWRGMRAKSRTANR